MLDWRMSWDLVKGGDNGTAIIGRDIRIRQIFTNSKRHMTTRRSGLGTRRKLTGN